MISQQGSNTSMPGVVKRIYAHIYKRDTPYQMVTRRIALSQARCIATRKVGQGRRKWGTGPFSGVRTSQRG